MSSSSRMYTDGFCSGVDPIAFTTRGRLDHATKSSLAKRASVMKGSAWYVQVGWACAHRIRSGKCLLPSLYGVREIAYVSTQWIAECSSEKNADGVQQLRQRRPSRDGGGRWPQVLKHHVRTIISRVTDRVHWVAINRFAFLPFVPWHPVNWHDRERVVGSHLSLGSIKKLVTVWPVNHILFFWCL